MKFFQKYGSRSIEVRRARREFIFRASLVLAVLLFFVAMLVIARFRPRLEVSDDTRAARAIEAGDPMTLPQLDALRGKVAEMREAYAVRAAEAPVDLDDLRILEKAIEHQRTVIRLRASEIAPRADLEQLEQLLQQYDEEMGAFLIAQSRSLEARAEAHYEAGELAAAADMVLRAQTLQEKINEQYPRSPDRNPARLYQLEKRAFDWRTRPMAEAADRLLEQARAEAETGNYSQARQTIQKALESQQQLAEAHRASRFATMARRREFESAWREIQIAEDADRVRHLIGEAVAATEAGRDQEALATAEKAEILNNRILARFPELEMERRQTGREIVAIKDTAASLPAFEEIRQLRERVRGMLRQRSTPNLTTSISQWHRALQQFRNRFPESRLTDQLHLEEATFLHGLREGIPALLATLHRNLLPIPGYNDLYLYRTEIPQSLYARLVGTNPSGNPDPDFPVESVTWREARDFIRKVGWILARETRLPTREAHIAAIGSVQPAELREGSWNSLNSSREIQAVGASEPNDFGFHDLLGNVSEWLHAIEETPGRVAAIGGSSRDNLLRLAEIPEESRSPDERNRFVGFRFTVRMNP